MITIVNRRWYKGSGLDITRKGLLGNPAVIGRDGDRDTVIEKYRIYIWVQYLTNHQIGRELDRLADIERSGGEIVLICCCKPENCHGDVLYRLLKWIAATPREEIERLRSSVGRATHL
jgi:hypothetical protein